MLRELLRQKLDVPGTDIADLSQRRIEALQRQIDAELRPLLRETDFAHFDLDQVVEWLQELVDAERQRE